MSLVPRSRPQLSHVNAEKILAFKNIDRNKYPSCVLAVRGYYKDSMGKPGVNDRSLYDDAGFVCGRNVFLSVNFNTDPNGFRKGYGRDESTKGMACLKEGVWMYEIGRHKMVYPAGVQADDVTVIRDGTPNYDDTGEFGINIHPGGVNSTSSIGCQTVPPDQWQSFIKPLVAALKEYGQNVFPYVLITEDEMNHILALDMPATEQPPPVGGPAPAPVPLPLPTTSRNMRPAVTIIKEFEGFFSKAYRDPVNIPTIGWGTIQYPDGRKVQMGDTCSASQAEEWLLFEMKEKSGAIEKMIKVSVTDNEFCALTSFAYNCGTGAFQGSTMLRKLNGGAIRADVATEFDKWVYAGGRKLNGLIRRRTAEKQLFLS